MSRSKRIRGLLKDSSAFDHIVEGFVKQELWVPKTYATWADALGIAVGSVKRLGSAGPVLARPEVR
jgi:hypothetical protein